MGWEHCSQGLYKLLLRLGRYRKPVFILENGTCVPDDALRWEFILQHLKSAHAARTHGVDLRGYLYWSLLDNFEWDKGFNRRFGLVEVDFATQQRRIRQSGRQFAEVCKTGLLV
jgi:beta-glucosidase/6-phospho-beta-glucosidase/beta-galactosidase